VLPSQELALKISTPNNQRVPTSICLLGERVPMGPEERGAPGHAGPQHGPERMPQQVSYVTMRGSQAQGNGNFHPGVNAIQLFFLCHSADK